MIANLYLHKDAFLYNGTDSKEQVVEKLRAFANDMRAIVYDNNSENVFCVSYDILKCEVYAGVSFTEAVSTYLDGELSCIIYTMLANTSEEFSKPMEELEKMAVYQPSETEVNTIVFFNCQEREKDTKHYIQFDNYEIVYNQSSWISLRRQILGNHPGTPISFVQNCKKYFCSLAFHENCVESLKDDYYDYLATSPRKIVYYLSCLNDCFKIIKESHQFTAPDANSILKDFSGQYGLDESGSIERNPEKKTLLTFSFSLSENEGEKKEMLCEPHLKISQPDSNSTADINYNTFHPRIYFHFGDPSVEKGNILVGSIGKHV